MLEALALLIGYLLGAIPFGFLLTRAAGLGDVRSIGSGNIGATNVLRTGNKGLAALTLLLDALKGTLAVWIASHWGLNAALLAGLGALLGHSFPAWLGFKGGKGVATYLGVLVALSWEGAVVFAVVWLAIAFTTRYSSLAALVAMVSVPAFLYLFGHDRVALLFIVMSAIAIARHHTNIRRLMDGTEGRIGART